jgi:2-methylisocitrate lyase-like PEP mutase family enzyme
MLEHLREIAGAVDVPVNADFEGGYADDPEGVAESVALAAATGIAGLSIEDSTRHGDEPLYPFDLAVERIRAARRAIDESGTSIVLTGRSEGFVAGRPDLDETIRRLQAYAEAGADCLYAPFVDTTEQVSAIVAAVAPKPVNLLVHKPFITVSEAAGLGVRRISIGGSLARVAQASFAAAAQEIADDGTFTRFANLPNNAAVNAVFGR